MAFGVKLPAEGDVADLEYCALSGVCDDGCASCASFEGGLDVTCFFNSSCWSCMLSICEETRLRIATSSTDVEGSSEALFSSVAVSIETPTLTGPGQYLPGEPN